MAWFMPGTLLRLVVLLKWYVDILNLCEHFPLNKLANLPVA